MITIEKAFYERLVKDMQLVNRLIALGLHEKWDDVVDEMKKRVDEEVPF